MNINVFKMGQPIVLGIYTDDDGIKSEDFTLKLSYTTNPLKSWKLNIKVIDDNPYWWSEVFYLFKPADYILSWINEKAGINLKVRIRVENSYFDVNDSEVLA